MDALQVKDVEFNGAMLKAVQDVNKIIWVGIKWVCDGIGLSEGQTKNERKRLQNDIVLSKGGRNFVLPTPGGNQAVSCLRLEYLPLWLAKISITPKMRENNPDVAERLVTYQLKAKDVLAMAFLPAIPQTSQPEPAQRFIQIPLPDYSGILDRMDVMESFILMKVAEQFFQSDARMEALEKHMDDFTMNMTNLSKFIVDKMEKFEMQLERNDTPMAAVKNAIELNMVDEKRAWRKKVSELMNRIVVHNNQFDDCKDVFKYMYNMMRREDGAVWEQYDKEYKEKYNVDKGTRIPRIDVCYDHKVLRSIFMNKLETLAYNCGAITDDYIGNTSANMGEEISIEVKSQTVTTVPLQLINEIIRPLIELKQDTSMYGVVTYKQVYQHMEEVYGVSWKNNETRYITKNGRKPTGRKLVIMDNPRLYIKFRKSVKDLIKQTEQKGTDTNE